MPSSSNSQKPVSRPHDPPGREGGITDHEVRWREALVLWLRWNEAYEHVTARMFESGPDASQLESLMDQMDELRRQAISLSHDLLD
jgi:hypothetical protein